jgi:hypothetical protein
MPPDEELIIRGKRKVNGEWVDVNESDELQKDKSAPLASLPPQVTKEGVTNAVKVQRAIRDLKTNAYFPPLAVIDAVKELAGGKVGEQTGAIPIGTGELRNVLTSIGAGLGSKTPLSPLGYAAGGMIGSGIGQEFEAAAPDLFQKGYGSEGVDKTVPSFSNAAGDAALNAISDALMFGGMKTAPYLLPKELGNYIGNTKFGKDKWKELIKDIQIGKYNPLKPGAIDSPLDKETVNAINNTPNVKMSTGDVLGEGNVFSRIQRFLMGEGEDSLKAQQNRQLGNEIIQFKDELGVPPAVLGKSQASEIGKEGVEYSQGLSKLLTKVESDAYNEIPKFASVVEVRKRPVIDKESDINKFRIKMGQPPLPSAPGTSRQVLGPVKLTGSNAAYKTNVAAIDKMLSQIDDPALQTELKAVRERLSIGSSLDLKDWSAIRETEAALNALGNNKNLSQNYKREIADIHATLVNDIERNLTGKVKETAKYWKEGAFDAYQVAKDRTKRKHNVFSKDITDAVSEAVGEIPAVPGIRGGEPASLFDNILESPEAAKRLSRAGGMKNARAAFVEKVLGKFQNAETQVLHGDKMLADLSTGKTSAIADVVLNQADKQKLRWLAKVSSRVNPKLNIRDQFAIQQGSDDWAFNLPGSVAAAALGGNKTGLIKDTVRSVVVHLKGRQFAEAFLNNDAWARELVNSIGKPVSRPGMSKQIGNLVRNIPLQGAKLLIKADGKEYEYDTDTKDLVEKK